MTLVSSISCESRQQTGIDRLALRLGLALVAWAGRSRQRRTHGWEERHARHEASRLRDALLEQRATAIYRLLP